jgi:(methylthio)acryloyl-CoA hydratase
MSDNLVTYESDGSIALIGINRQHKRNALSLALMDALGEATARATGEARAAVIFGHGEHFSAGLDLAEFASSISSGERRQRRLRWLAPLEVISRGEIPFVVALSGACIGGGLELAAAAHVRVADDTTFFALPEGQHGIFVGGGASVRVQRLLGYARMADMMLTRRTLSAVEGERYNLCQYVEATGQALDRAKELARKIAENASLTNWAVCSCLPRVNDLSHDDGLFMEGLICTAVSSRETVGRVNAFVEKKTAPINRPTSSSEANPRADATRHRG